MLHRFNFVNLSKGCYQGSQRERYFGNQIGSPSEELLETQALSVSLREAVMACLYGENPG